ncbi:MAG: hypothetical protein PHU08_06595 [Dehalococcoidales bacterium]|nr:hypothetical protein [Dehalococcoidales bacterium]
MDRPQSPPPALETSQEIVEQLAQVIRGGKHWYIALLEAIGLWPIAEETHHGRSYRYLIAGEAFDWLLLAERLCQAVDNLLPEAEKTALLFHNHSPLDLTRAEFKKLIGSQKYQQYLNYFYGITVEEALIRAVLSEVRKERQTLGQSGEHGALDEAFRRIYGASRTTLLNRFRREWSYPQLNSISLTELKEFTYWLFKYRLRHCDQAKVASDTKKALKQLNTDEARKL